MWVGMGFVAAAGSGRRKADVAEQKAKARA